MNRLIKGIVTVIIYVTSVVTTKAVIVIPDSVILGNYPYVRLLSKGTGIQLTDDEFYNLSRKVTFPVNKYALPENSPLLKELEREVIPLINKDSLTLHHLMIRGAASPEGPYEFNKTLSEKRSKSIFDFINSRLTVPVSKEEDTRIMIPEDYQYLCKMMNDAGDPDYMKVKLLCDKYLPTDNITELKSSLQKLDGGKLWRRLLKTYFPELRSSRVVIFVEKPEKVVEQPEKVEVPQTERIEIATIPEPDTVIIEPVIEPEVEPNIYPRREMLSVKTNLLLDAAYVPGYDRWCPIPNIAIEYYPKKGHFTYGASFDMPWWQDYDAHKYFQLRNYQVESRYYFKTNGADETYEANRADGTKRTYRKPRFSGYYLQGYVNGGIFGICFDADRGWVGEGIGGGVGFGYVTPISRNGHWRLDFGLQVGFFRCKYDPYQYENPVDPSYHDDLYYYKWTLEPSAFKKRQYRWNWIGPTRIGITLSYDLLYKRIHKKGVSFKDYEIYEAYGPNEERRAAE